MIMLCERVPLNLACIAFGVLMTTAGSEAQTYRTFAIQDELIEPVGINSSGTIVGYYEGRDNVAHGFVRAADGTTSLFDVEGARTTEPKAIDEEGAVVGSYQNPDFSIHGFIRKANGVIDSFDPPKSRDTFVSATATDIAGTEEPKKGAKGFIRFHDGSYSIFKYPRTYDTEPTGINDAGAVVGIYRRIKSDTPHGFLRNPNGTFETLVSHGHTWPVAINASGTVVGSDNHEGVFVRTADGTTTTFNVADAVTTEPMGLNAKGAVVGFYLSEDMTKHGFLWTPEQGVVLVDVPQMTNTTLTAINDDDVIVGTCIDSDGHEAGFIRTP